MSNSKLSKPSKSKNSEDVELLKSDIASFASSLGLASSASVPSSGFNDTDFRKKGLLKPPKTPKHNDENQKSQFEGKPRKFRNSRADQNNKSNYQKPKPKPPVLSLDDSSNFYSAPKDHYKFKNMPTLPLVKASALGLWYEDALQLEMKVFGDEGKSTKKLEVKDVVEWKRVVDKKREMGERFMWQYTQDYESSRGKVGDMKMVTASQRSGTAADKVSAFSFVVADNPVANMKSLDALVGMVTSKVGKRYAFTGFEALRELFISKLLPDQKLKTLLQRPVNDLPENKDGHSLLLFWYWEDCLKQRYERFVVALEEASRDMLPALKDKALKTMYVLLKSKSEQERRLLSALVNKLGDPQNKGASNADFYLSNLLSEHPNMKAVVIDEVDSFLFRPHLGQRAKYHAVNFLSQIFLSRKGDGPKVAKRLIDVYFALFKVLITEADTSQKVDNKSSKTNIKNSSPSIGNKLEGTEDSHIELDSRILSALLTGVNRAFPYVSSDEADDIIEVETPMLFKLVHSKNFNVGIQALMLLHKISSKNQIASDRFYRALYSKLLLPAAMNSSKAEMFIGLILRAMKGDINLKRVAAFAKRVLQVALQQPPQFACGCLFLLSEVLKARTSLWNMVLQNESIDEEIEHFEDIVEEDNGTSSASKIEGNNVDLHDNENASKKEENKDDHGGDSTDSDDSSAEGEDDLPASYFEDDDSDDEEDLFIRNSSNNSLKSKTTSDDDHIEKPQVFSTRTLPGGYNPRHREPAYCNADRASWWELMVLATHVHPSVATMARTLLSGANIVYNGNPLNDLSLTAFLDKFMEKKPKASVWHGGSQIEPAKKLDMGNQLIGPEILSLAESEVPPEDLVFHKFYMNKSTTSKKSKKKKKKHPEEEAAEELFEVHGRDESDNEEIEQMLDTANFSHDADGDYDYDDLDQVADEDDDELIGDASDAEMEIPSDNAGEDFDMADDDDAIDIGDADDDEEGLHQNKRNRKPGTTFASLEDYEHLLNEDGVAEEETKRKTKRIPSIPNVDGVVENESRRKKMSNRKKRGRSSSSK